MVPIKNRRRGFYQRLRITAISHRYADVSLANTCVPVACVLSAFNTQLAHNRVFVRVRGESARRHRVSPLSPVYGQFSRPFFLSLSLIISYRRLALPRIPSPPLPVFSLSRTLRTLYEQLVVSQYRDIVADVSSVSLSPSLLLPSSVSLSLSPFSPFQPSPSL